jgi:hypothetical protein
MEQNQTVTDLDAGIRLAARDNEPEINAVELVNFGLPGIVPQKVQVEFVR